MTTHVKIECVEGSVRGLVVNVYWVSKGLNNSRYDLGPGDTLTLVVHSDQGINVMEASPSG